MNTWFRAAAIVAVLILDSSTAIAQSRTINFTVDQLPQTGGGFVYQLVTLQSGHTSFGIPNGNASLTAPNGSVFPASTNVVNFNTFGDLGSTLFGDWTAIEHPTAGPDNTYTIHVDPFTLAGVFSETPVIASPTPGSTVPTDFVVKWAFPSGATPSSRGASASSSSVNILGSLLGADGFYSIAYHTKLISGPGDISIQVRTSSFPPAPSVTSGSPSLVGQSIDAFLSFRSQSLSATYHVVPEPCALALAWLALAITGLTGFRRR